MLSYLYHCLRQRVKPWNFFHLNSTYFNESKGIFSKLDMDEVIPAKWRLRQEKYDPERIPDNYPVFLKPEWGQNANGIYCVHSECEFSSIGKKIESIDMNYIVQEAAPGKYEYEIYYLRSPNNTGACNFLSITRVINRSSDKYPVNSIHNTFTSYVDISTQFSEPEKRKLWDIISSIGFFRMARVGVKADGVMALLDGKFKIVEINLFLPMPLVLLSINKGIQTKIKIISQLMETAAGLVASIPANQTQKWIFFRKLKAHYKVAR